MKSFTTPEYIKPVIEAINANYQLITDPQIKLYFDMVANKCSFVIGWNTENRFKGVYRNIPLDYFPEFKKAYQEIDQFAEAASTYPGELDRWSDNEKLRFNEAVKVALIDYTTQRIKSKGY